MGIKNIFSIFLIFSLFFGLGFSATSISSCTNITSAGEYVVTANLDGAGSTCITINVSNVVLDLNSSIISNATTASNSSIYVQGLISAELQNITIMNGTLNQSDDTLQIDYTQNSTFANIVVTHTGTITSSITGVLLDDVDNSTFTNFTVSGVNSAFLVDGALNTFENNTASHLRATAFAVQEGTGNNIFRSNVVTNVTQVQNGVGSSSSAAFFILTESASNNYTNNTVNMSYQAFLLGESSNNVITNNTVDNYTYGIALVSTNWNNFSNNELLNGNGYGYYLINATNTTISNGTIRGNTNASFYVNASSDRNNTLNITTLSFYGVPNTNYTIISMNESVDASSVYTLNWSSAPATPPFGTTPVSHLNITNLSGSVSIESIHFSWDDAQVSSESNLNLFKYNGSWNNLNSTPDTTSNILALNNIGTFSVFSLIFYPELSSDGGGEESDPPGSLGQLEVSTSSSCDAENIIATVLDSNGDPVSGAEVFVRIQDGAYVSGSPFTTNADGNIEFTNPTQGTIYEFQADKSPDYEESLKVYETLACLGGGDGFEINHEINCEDETITLSTTYGGELVCSTIYLNSDLDFVGYVDGECSNGYIYSFADSTQLNGEHFVTFNYEGNEESVTVDTSVCEGEGEIDYEVVPDVICEGYKDLPASINLNVYVDGSATSEETCSFNFDSELDFEPLGSSCDPEVDGDCACLSVGSSFSENKTYEVTVSRDGYPTKTIEVDTTYCDAFTETEDQQLLVTNVVPNCDANELELTLTDQDGQRVNPIYTIDAGELGAFESGPDDLDNFKSIVSDCNLDAVNCIPKEFAIPFTSDGEYEITVSKEGYQSSSVSATVSCDVIDDDGKINYPDENNTNPTVVIGLPDGEEEELDDGNSISDQFGPGSYTVSVYQDGELVASKTVVIPKEEEDNLATFLAENSAVCASLILLLLILGLFLWWRRRKKEEDEQTKHKKYKKRKR